MFHKLYDIKFINIILLNFDMVNYYTMKLEVIFSNKPSSLNKKLLKFFKLNMLSLTKASILFDFKVAHPEDKETFETRGITNFPVAIKEGSSITGAEKIMAYMKHIVGEFNKTQSSKTDEQRVDDYWRSTIGTVDADGNAPDDSEDEDESEKLQKKLQAAYKDRSDTSEIGSSKKPKSTPKSSSNNVSRPAPKKPKSSDPDDDLMAKFFENNGTDV